MKFTGMSPCGFSNDLLSYLYEEISPAESRAFEVHLESCLTCRSEFSEFTSVRDAVGLWRDDILAMAQSSGVALPSAEQSKAVVLPSKRSAVAAFREFFSLSPLWLRGATAFAAFAVFGLLAFSIWRISQPDRVVFREIASATPSPLAKPAPTAVDDSNPIVIPQPTGLSDASEDSRVYESPKPISDSQPSAIRRHINVRAQKNHHPFNASEYAVLDDARNSQILSDLGLVSSREDEISPRLSDLIVEPESNN